MFILQASDLVIYPLFLIFFLFILKKAGQRYRGTELEQHYHRAIYLRFFGAFLSGLMYQYYYGYGDTYFYFTGASDILRGFIKDPSVGLEMVFKKFEDLSPEAKHNITFVRFFLNDSEALVIRIAGLFNLLSFGSYFGISLWFTSFSFLGCWLLYRVFTDIYPHLHRPLAWAILYLPSLWFWGTGVMKDPLTLASLGIYVYGLYRFFIQGKSFLLSISMMALGAWLMSSIKLYILVAILPASMVWVFFMYKNKIRNPLLQKLATPFFLVLGLVAALTVFQFMGRYFAKYASLDKILEEAHKTQWWLAVSTERDGGTGYTLGDFDTSPMGLVSVFPRAVNVALFRPYLWEARKPIVLPSALEALINLLLTLYVLFKTGLRRILPAIFTDPVVLFCLIFALIFGFAVGFTSFNFGALARYRIPCLPFYSTLLVILLDKARQTAAAKQGLEGSKDLAGLGA